MTEDGPFGPVVNGTQIVFYEYRPNQPAALTFIALFGLATLAHLVCTVILRAWFFIPFVLGGICETFGYVGRAWSHNDPARPGPFILQNVLLLAGSPFLAATVYMSLDRVTTALHAQNLSRISTRWMTKIYVVIDVGCIFSQFIGALMPVNGDEASITRGHTIIIVGLVVQLGALSFFILTSWHIYRGIMRDPAILSMNKLLGNWRKYFRAIEIVTVVMVVRGVVRAAEFLQGEGGYVISHEAFIYAFDAALMFGIMVVYAVVHPGRLVRANIRAMNLAQDTMLQDL
ncbi:hypothetical protein BDW74DRAFT_174759 [Aspergillus multicolor]|uniref:RTA1 domain-containing protein n=1 Tax=Aspergillus multicolor TaxID=41759 RepID=UPI003CCDA477